MTGLKRSYVANLLLILLGVALPLLGAEYTFRIIRVLAKKPPYYQSDPVLGWAPVPNADIKGMPVVSSDGAIATRFLFRLILMVFATQIPTGR